MAARTAKRSLVPFQFAFILRESLVRMLASDFEFLSASRSARAFPLRAAPLNKALCTADSKTSLRVAPVMCSPAGAGKTLISPVHFSDGP